MIRSPGSPDGAVSQGGDPGEFFQILQEGSGRVFCTDHDGRWRGMASRFGDGTDLGGKVGIPLQGLCLLDQIVLAGRFRCRLTTRTAGPVVRLSRDISPPVSETTASARWRHRCWRRMLMHTTTTRSRRYRSPAGIAPPQGVAAVRLLSIGSPRSCSTSHRNESAMNQARSSSCR